MSSRREKTLHHLKKLHDHIKQEKLISQLATKLGYGRKKRHAGGSRKHHTVKL